MLDVILLSVANAECHDKALYADCRCTECCGAYQESDILLKIDLHVRFQMPFCDLSTH